MGYKVKNTEEFLVNMRKTGYSQGGFADKLGISPQWLSAIAHKRSLAGTTLAKSIVGEMNLELQDVFLKAGVALKETKTTKDINDSVKKTTTKENLREWKLLKTETTKQ